MGRRRIKDGELAMYYGKLDRYSSPDVIYHTGDGVPRCDRAFLHYALGCERMALDIDKGGYKFDPSFLAELEARGYDLKTLRFSISLKAEAVQNETPVNATMRLSAHQNVPVVDSDK